MIAYFDTSAVIPLLVDEPGSETALSVWLGAESVVSTRLLYAEAGAALVRAARLDRLTPRALDQALGELDGIWSQLFVVEIDDILVRTAAALARQHSLRGYDAVHCSAALRIAGPDTVAVAGDGDLISAWRDEGLQIVNTHV